MIITPLSLFEVEYGVIVHGCNCSGGFGSGIARQMKERYPIVEKVFRATPPCPELLGEIQVVKVTDDLFVVNAFTQNNYGHDGGKYADAGAIQTALKSAIRFANKIGHDIHVPKIGCGLGGLDWETDVKPIYTTLAMDALDHDMLFYVHDYKPLN